MDKNQSNWGRTLSLGSVLCAFIVIIANATGNDQVSGIFAISSLLFALMAAPLAFTKNTAIPIKVVKSK